MISNMTHSKNTKMTTNTVKCTRFPLMEIFDIPCLREEVFTWVKYDITWGDMIMESMANSNFHDMIYNKDLLKYFLSECVKTLSVTTYPYRFVPSVVTQGSAKVPVYYDCLDISHTPPHGGPRSSSGDIRRKTYFYRALRRWPNLGDIFNVVLDQTSDVGSIASMCRRLTPHQLTVNNLCVATNVFSKIDLFSNANVVVLRFAKNVSLGPCPRVKKTDEEDPKKNYVNVHTLVIHANGMFSRSAKMIKMFIHRFVSDDSKECLFNKLETIQFKGSWVETLCFNTYASNVQCLVLEDLICIDFPSFSRKMSSKIEDNYPSVNELHMTFMHRERCDMHTMRNGFFLIFRALSKHSVIFVNADILHECGWGSQDSRDMPRWCRLIDDTIDEKNALTHKGFVVTMAVEGNTPPEGRSKPGDAFRFLVSYEIHMTSELDEMNQNLVDDILALYVF